MSSPRIYCRVPPEPNQGFFCSATRGSIFLKEKKTSRSDCIAEFTLASAHKMCEFDLSLWTHQRINLQLLLYLRELHTSRNQHQTLHRGDQNRISNAPPALYLALISKDWARQVLMSPVIDVCNFYPRLQIHRLRISRSISLRFTRPLIIKWAIRIIDKNGTERGRWKWSVFDVCRLRERATRWLDWVFC